MKKIFKMSIMVGLVVLWASLALATNGDNLIGIGPISRAMGGVGIAAPQDAISAVFSNPAAMCFGPYCPDSEFNFAGTLFTPKVDAKVQLGGQPFKRTVQENVYAIPAIGLSTPITKSMPLWRFGLAAYGVSGLGVDYRNTDLDQPRFANFGGFPLVAGEYTQLQIMKFAPSIAFRARTPNFPSVWPPTSITPCWIWAAAPPPDTALGSSWVSCTNPWTAFPGATYVTPQKITYCQCQGFRRQRPVRLTSTWKPRSRSAWEWPSISCRTSCWSKLDGKWINWANATGYKDFDWEDQWVFGIGAQYQGNGQAGPAGRLQLCQ